MIAFTSLMTNFVLILLSAMKISWKTSAWSAKSLACQLLICPNLKTGFRQKRHHYSEYFDENSKAIVAEKHTNDIRLFGYKFVQL